MTKTVLITGGAGFVGSHLADELLAHGYKVRALDNLDPQVHGPKGARPSYLDDRVDLIVGDVRNTDAVDEALSGADAVVHLAACVGVGQSMYEIARYTAVNNLGTAVLLERVVRHQVERLIVASSMSVYGEGLYEDERGTRHHQAGRTRTQLENRDWEPMSEEGEQLRPRPTPEDKAPNLASIYALSKYDQERMSLLTGQAYGIPTVALRFFNIYGPRQALSNPYTGVLAIFATRLLNGNAPLIFEDGKQKRDFVSVHDAARACRLALESSAGGGIFNIGSGRARTVLEMANRLANVLDRPTAAEVTGRYRTGDIRHCFADITRAHDVLGYQPIVSLDDGLEELSSWLERQEAVDQVDRARSELDRRGLTL